MPEDGRAIFVRSFALGVVSRRVAAADHAKGGKGLYAPSVSGVQSSPDGGKRRSWREASAADVVGDYRPRHGFDIGAGELQFKATDTRQLFDQLKVRAFALVEKAVTMPNFQLRHSSVLLGPLVRPHGLFARLDVHRPRRTS